ncbi:MAG: alpha-L-fucosidase, partial [Bacteroidetes bacterium]|nr:alpha-L-fucosidase [Bacteroidota bacterium]
MFEACDPVSAMFSDINWKEMMRTHDLLWKVVPADMTEAPHFGNGLLGSMIWVEDNTIRLQVFRSDVHDHNDHTYGWTAYSRPRYQIGYFTLKTKGEITDCDLRQDIYNARLKGRINTKLGSLNIDHFVHRHDDVIYTGIQASGEEKLSDWKWHPFEAKPSRGGDPGSKGYGQAYAPYNKQKNPEHLVENYEGISVGHQDLSSGGDYATAWKVSRVGNDKSTMLITIQNSYPEKTSVEDAIKVIDSIHGKIEAGYRKWRAEHQSWWHNYYPESYVSFPEPDGMSMYWNNVYRLACCTRPDAQYIDTPGMWNSGGPWPYSTHDYNTQTVHFPLYSANRLHLGEALVNALKRNKVNLIDNVVPEEWQDDSALLNLATAFDMRGKRNGDGRYKEMVGCLPWLLNNVWLHYRYTMDTEILKDPLLPLLRRSINLYRHLLFEGEDGKLHLPPTFSPETGNFSDCNFDLALIRWGCKRLLEICRILEIDDPLIPEWENIYDQLVEYQVDEKGYKLGKEKSAPSNHQHMSHLLMIYPLYLENIDDSDNIELLEKSVINFQPATALPKMAASQSSPAAATLGLGNLAHQLMNSILYSQRENEKLGKNGIYYLATPCIETSLSYNTCVQDMLLQSWGNKIRVFPALPDIWKDVEFHDFRTEGAFLVSAKLENGITSFIRIKSLAGEPCIIKSSIEGTPMQSGGNKVWMEELDDGCYLIDLKKGEEVILYTEQQEV